MASPASDRARLRHRRLLLLFLVVASTVGAVLVLGTILAADGFSVLELAILALFTALFAWITTACWITVIGFRSEEHTSELQSLIRISYAVFCLKNNNLLIT